MIRAVREGAEALKGMLTELKRLGTVLEEWPEPATLLPPDLSTITDRLDRLEVGYAKWQAEAEATYLKADALFKNARNSEERARSREKATDEGSDESEEFDEAMRGWVLTQGSKGDEENGLSEMRRPPKPPSLKDRAVRAKFR